MDMGFSNQKKQAEVRRVAAWKERNPEKVANQRKRKSARKRAEKRALDPTGELNYGDIDGVDKPYPDYPDTDSGSRVVPAPKAPPLPEPEGIPDPPDFVEELEREHKRRILENCRRELEKLKDPPRRA